MAVPADARFIKPHSLFRASHYVYSDINYCYSYATDIGVKYLKKITRKCSENSEEDSISINTRFGKKIAIALVTKQTNKEYAAYWRAFLSALLRYFKLASACTMTSLIVLWTVFLIADITIDQVLADDFIKLALENLRHQNEDPKISGDKYQEQRDDDDDDDDDDSNVRPLKDDDLALLELVLKGKESNRKKKHNYQPTHFDQLTRLGVNDVLVYNPESRSLVHTERQKNPLLEILGSSKHANAALDEEINNSPIYVLVKADIKRNKPGDSVSDLLSSLLKSSSSGQNDRSSGKQEQRYKGFRVKDPYRRARDSNEKYSSVEVEEKRPLSRPRAYGGGGGGRTPIPYIRHRGDIFEKDN